ncbi:hypothetical protein LCGC14_1860820 [marine sediment metagenome]|uniref:Methyltransferase small domain-containing protein n=1 Tax=marine sediment metagenome TaxID=412755 RepID=A0A0F9J6N0_9ZZZZ
MLEVGNKFCLKGLHDTAKPPAGRFCLNLVPSDKVQLYGPDTLFFMKEMEELIKPGMFVVEAGTGSGILAMTAYRLEAKVLAYDIYPPAIALARENFKANGLLDKIQLTQRGWSDEDYPGPLADILIANMGKHFFETNSHRAALIIKPGGLIAFSCPVEVCLQPLDFAVEKTAVIPMGTTKMYYLLARRS